jgi:hypothetical protein
MLRNDSAVEGNETFTITVLAVDDNVIVDNGTVTITIVDGEGLHSPTLLRGARNLPTRTTTHPHAHPPTHVWFLGPCKDVKAKLFHVVATQNSHLGVPI